MNIEARIQKGRGAIAQAKAQGRDVSDWEKHLARLEQEAKEDQADPIVSIYQWYPDFRDFHHKVIAETPDFDYLWLKTHKPDLYQTIRAKENALDDLRDARLSEIMAIMREWRGLILQAEFERRRANKGKAEGNG